MPDFFPGACFFGTVSPCPIINTHGDTDPSQCPYSWGSRQALAALTNSSALRFGGWRSDAVWGGTAYREAMCQCAWSLAPSGWNPQSPRLIDATLLGVPSVIIAAGLRKPFVRFLDWNEFTISCVCTRCAPLQPCHKRISSLDLCKIFAFAFTFIAVSVYIARLVPLNRRPTHDDVTLRSVPETSVVKDAAGFIDAVSRLAGAYHVDFLPPDLRVLCRSIACVSCLRFAIRRSQLFRRIVDSR